ncbi:MAG TPA: nucleotidyl transferase AbiEii/AbiGii toxin family protein [Thermoleophilaceae bacterium]
MGLPEFDPRALLEALTRRGVDFVVVGGFAAVVHGSPRLTQDLDITYATDRVNLAALAEVLLELGARLRQVDEDLPFEPDERALARTEMLTLTTSAGALDLLAKPAGAPAYARLRERAERVDLGGMAVLVASIEDLVAMKRAAGRAKDLADIEELEAIRRLRA